LIKKEVSELKKELKNKVDVDRVEAVEKRIGFLESEIIKIKQGA